MNNVDKQYLDLMQDILDNGVKKNTRAGDVLSVFGRTLRFNLKEGLPMLTTKKVFSRGCIEELLWFLKGSTNIKYLVEKNVHIWDDDAYRYYRTLINRHNKYIDDNPGCGFEYKAFVVKEEFLDSVKEEKTVNLKIDEDGVKRYVFGDLGPVYGKQWRSFGVKGVDQIKNVIETLKNNPDDRRMLVVAFNPDVLDEVALPPCHVMFQFYSKPLENGKRELSCMYFCRSQDLILGTPFNILSYSVLLTLISHCVDMECGELISNMGDCHIYLNQMDAVKEQLSHDPYKYDLPTLWLNPDIKNIDDFTIDDIKILNYESYPKIYAPLSVGNA